jgi:hypothetical protein
MRRPKCPRVLGWFALGAAFFNAQSAFAFCQATTCDPSVAADQCTTDAQNCLTTGAPLAWPSNCVTVSVQATGAPQQDIDYATALGSVTRAFAAWTSTECDDGAPSINVKVTGPITCDAAEYDEKGPNANIVVFRQDVWPYMGGQDALGLTSIHFDPKTGDIWDADIEVNAVAEPLSVGALTPDAVDLDSLLTHEAGHFLGLAHTVDISATMFPKLAKGDSLRTLAQDDISGVCSIYPPKRSAPSTSCEPRGGFSDLCIAERPPSVESSTPTAKGCSASPGVARAPWGWVATVGMLLALAWTRKRRSQIRILRKRDKIAMNE